MTDAEAPAIGQRFIDVDTGWTGHVATIRRDDAGAILSITGRLDEAIDGKTWVVWDLRRADVDPSAPTF